MTDETKNSLDMFGITDIDKIQEEIERDLAAVQVVGDQSVALQNSFMAYSSINQPTESVFTAKVVPAVSDVLQIDVPVQLPATSDFYRETIKNTHHGHSSFVPWLKKAIALFLIFTLGTGSLGIGIGAGFGYFYFSRREANEPVHAGDSNGDALTLTSTIYTFENIVEDHVVGTLADVVEFIKPSVVGITGHYGQEPVRHGTGIIFAENDDQIFIVTSIYVVRNRQVVMVSINGSEPIEAHPAGDDTTVEISVISVYKTQLIEAGINSIVIASFGDSDQMRVGDTVLAIGNAMGEGNSVTRGVVSASEKRVTLPGAGHVLSLMQTDAAINYGSSGGPLINTRGEVIGVNLNRMSNIIFGNNLVEGMSYSVSSNIIAPLLDDIINQRRPALGIMGQTLPLEVASRFGIPTIGVYVSTVMPGRSACRGGMRPHDIITGFNGLPVLNWQQLVYAIRSSTVGETVEVIVLRDGEHAHTLLIELDAMIVDNF